MTRGKRGHALAAARGDKKALAAIATANEAIAAAERRRADLQVALELARAEVAAAERERQRAGGRGEG